MSIRINDEEWFKLVAESGENPVLPIWLGEAALLGRYWLESAVLNELIDKVLVTRRKMGRYEVSDFILLLNTYAISGYKSLKEFFQDLKPVADILMSLWRQEQCRCSIKLK